MSFVTLAEAKLHLRVDGTDEDALIGLYINAAEQSAVSLLDRGVYVDGTALTAAKAAAPGELDTAIAAYESAIAAAEALADETAKAASIQTAGNDLLRAKVAHRHAMDGMVVNESIKAWLLLTIGTLYANRESIQTGVPGATAALPGRFTDSLLDRFKVY